MNSPILSVVMSVYNAEKYLEQSIESILSQSFTDFEFIIIEDCSTDNSLEILKNYEKQDSRIRVIQKTENKRMRGFIENLNIGLSEARGKYIARMDADDISHLDRFEKQVIFLDSHPNVFMVGSAINFIDENGKLIRKYEALETDYEIKKQMIKKISIYHPTIMFRNYKEVRYREKMFYCEDYDLYLRLMLQDKIFANFSEALLDYRLLGSSLSRRDSKFIKALFVEKMKQFYHEYRKKGKDSYEHFVPNDLLNILNLDIKSSEKNLQLALHIATKFGYKKVFTTLSKKYPNQKNIYTLKILNSLPLIFSKIYFKFINNNNL